MVIAVVGPRGVGKSTIIKKGLGRPLDKYVVLSEDLSKNQGEPRHLDAFPVIP